MFEIRRPRANANVGKSNVQSSASPSAPLTSQHNPLNLARLNLNGPQKQEKLDVMLGRVQWSLENTLRDPKFRGNRKVLQKRIQGLQKARDHLAEAQKAQPLSAGDIAVAHQALQRAGEAVSNPPQKRAVQMMATYLEKEWGDAKKQQIATFQGKATNYLKDNGAISTSGKSTSIGVGADTGQAALMARLEVGSKTSDHIDHAGSHVHINRKKVQIGVGASASAIAANADVGVAIGREKNTSKSEVYEGGTEEYVRAKGYKSHYGSIKVDAKTKKIKKEAGVSNLGNPLKSSRPSNQVENLATAQVAALGEKVTKRQKLLSRVGIGPKNDLRNQELVKQETRNQESLFKGLMHSEFGLDVEFSKPEQKKARTRIEGTSNKMSVSARMSAGIPNLPEKATANAEVSGKVAIIETDEAYTRYIPMWDQIKKESTQGEEELSNTQRQRKKAVMKAAIKHTQNHSGMFAREGVTIELASKKELEEALKRLEADIDNYTSHKKILNRVGSKTSLSGAMKRDVRALEREYGVNSHSVLKNADRSADKFIIAATQIHAALGMRLMDVTKQDKEAQDKEAQNIDRVAKKVQNIDVSHTKRDLLKETHFSSSSEVQSTTKEKTFTVRHTAELEVPGVGLRKQAGVSVVVAMTEQTKHPDKYSKGKTLEISLSLPPGLGAISQNELALQIASKLDMPELHSEIVGQLADVVSMDSDTEGKLSVTMKFSKPVLNSDEKNSRFQLEYATARVATKNRAKGYRGKAIGGGLGVEIGATRSKKKIVPVGTVYGSGSLRNVIKAYNASQTATINGQENSWAEQKQKRQLAITRMLVKMGEPNSVVRSEAMQIFNESIAALDGPEKVSIIKKKEDFFKLMDTMKTTSQSSTLPDDVLDKANAAMEGFLSMQHQTWLENIKEGSAQENKYSY